MKLKAQQITIDIWPYLGLASVGGASVEKMVTISEREYRSLQAAAELVRHPEALARTILALKNRNTVDLEEAFPETAISPAESLDSATDDLLQIQEDELFRAQQDEKLTE